MPKFCANIIFLFNEFDFMDRINMAARCGFKAIECQRPYDIPAPELNAAMAAAGVEMVLINTPPSSREPSDSGVAVFPDRIAEFQDLTEMAIRYAAEIGCPRLHVVAGRSEGVVTHDVATDTFIANILWAADLGQRQGVRILIEPLNGVDNPGYFLTTAGQARRILDTADHRNLYLQYDLYHAGVNAEDIVGGAAEHLAVIDHMQMAGVPDRHEPTVGDIDMPAIFERIDEMGYQGWVGAEYRPQHATLDGLDWGRPYGISAPAAT